MHGLIPVLFSNALRLLDCFLRFLSEFIEPEHFTTY